MTTTTYPDGTRGVHLNPRATLAHLDPFQRATTGFHTLAHCGWTLARQGEVIQVCEFDFAWVPRPYPHPHRAPGRGF